jgi:hypothetical protein
LPKRAQLRQEMRGLGHGLLGVEGSTRPRSRAVPGMNWATPCAPAGLVTPARKARFLEDQPRQESRRARLRRRGVVDQPAQRRVDARGGGLRSRRLLREGMHAGKQQPQNGAVADEMGSPHRPTRL